MPENFFELRHVKKHFHKIKAVDDVSFIIKKGEVHALLGENGAGKSTLMNLIAGVYRMDDGEMWLDGEPYAPRNTREARHAGVSIVFQELSLFSQQNVTRNIFAGKELKKKTGIDHESMNGRAKQILKEMCLDVDLSLPVSELSIGQQQWVEIARALADDAKILILDEPNSALNSQETAVLFEIITQLKAQGITIIFISHRLDEVFEIADRVTIMRDGHYITTLEAAETSADAVIPILLGQESHTLFERGTTATDEVVLEVKNLSVTGEAEDVSFTVHAGEVVGMAGLAGCGISGVIQALFGIRTPSSGEIFIQGRQIRPNSPEDAMREHIAFVPNDRRDAGLMLDWSIEKNIAMAVSKFTSHLGILDHKKNRSLADSFSRELNVITESIRTRVIQLSGGNQQKVLLAKWLATEPRLLILDDPTRGIDVGAKKEIYQLIDEIAKQGFAIIMTSSEIDETVALSDKILLFRDGALIRTEPRGTNKETVLRYVAGDAGRTCKNTSAKENATEETDTQKKRRSLGPRISRTREAGVFIALIAVIALFSLVPGFMTTYNISIILKQMSVFGVIAIGMTYVFSAGEVDISVGWILNAAMAVAGRLIQDLGFNPWFAAIGAILFAGLLGAVNGFLGARLKLPTIVITLGTMTIYRGLSLAINGGRTIGGLGPSSFFNMGRASIAGISVLSIVMLALFVVFAWHFRNSRFARHALLKGDNAQAAERCGITVDRMRFLVMMFSGVMCGVAAMLSLSNLTAADTTTGGGYELSVIGAVIVGGTKMGGGSGTIWGSLIGIALITTIENGLVFLGLSVGWRSFFIGLIIIVAIGIDQLVQKRRK